MNSATCTDCGALFSRAADEQWKRRCLGCWKASRPAAERRTPDDCLRWYHKGYAAGRASALAEREAAPPALDSERVRQLIRLCHPDLHNGSKLATSITAWLLDLRRRVSA